MKICQWICRVAGSRPVVPTIGEDRPMDFQGSWLQAVPTTAVGWDLCKSMEINENPPRPCASKRVEAPTGQQTLQTLENKLPRGRVSLPLPPPSGPARSTAAGSRFLVASLTLQKCFKNEYFFNFSFTLEAYNPHLKTKKRPNTEPQGAPGALETFIR